MSLAGGAFDGLLRTILAAPDYPAFARLLRESACTRCALWEGRTQIVVDRGSPGAGIMAVGEGPGEKEDRQGRAFVGRAGRLLDELLREAGLDPERHLLIANIVKCRPPGNRAPTKEEAATCLPYLHRQIELARPHTILLLGATALRHLLHGRAWTAIGKEVGRMFAAEEFPGVGFMATYHPAYLLRDPRRKPEARAHLQALREELAARGKWPGKG